MASTTVCTVLLLAFAFAESSSLLPALFKRGSRCNDVELERCVEPVAMIGRDPIGSSRLEGVDQEEALDAVCEALDDAKKCIARYLHGCYGSESEVAVKTIEGVLGYLCGEGRSALLSEQACWENTALERRLNDCAEEMQLRAFDLMVNGGSVEDLCPIFDDVRGCARGKVLALCNSEVAAEFIDKLMYYAIKEPGKQIGCDMKLRMTRDIHRLISKVLRK